MSADQPSSLNEGDNKEVVDDNFDILAHIIREYAENKAKCWRSMVTRVAMARSYATSTPPKMKPFAPTIDASHPDHPNNFKGLPMKGEFAPVMVVMGFVAVVMMFGTHTAKQQLMYSPSVSISKKKRESMTEVDDPDTVINSADKFVNKSFFRKVAHIQENKQVLPDPVRPNPFTTPRDAETLKSAGVNPSLH